MRKRRDNGGGRGAPLRPGRNTQQTPTLIRTASALSVADGPGGDVIDLDAGRRRRVQAIEAGAGPWWGGYLLRSASWAEASRTRWSA